MKRKITISIPTDDPECRVHITPTGKNTVMIAPEAQKFAVSSDELKAALDEAERYRQEFEEKEKGSKEEKTTISVVAEYE